MSTTPPARRIGRKSAVSGPQVAFVFFQSEVVSDFLWVANTFKYTHILTAGKDKSIAYLGVDFHNLVDDIIILRQIFKSVLPNFKKVPPNQRRVGDSRRSPCWYPFSVNCIKMVFQKSFSLFLSPGVEIHDMKSVEVSIVRI